MRLFLDVCSNGQRRISSVVRCHDDSSQTEAPSTPPSRRRLLAAQVTPKHDRQAPCAERVVSNRNLCSYTNAIVFLVIIDDVHVSKLNIMISEKHWMGLSNLM